MAEKFQVDFEANLTGNLKQEVEEVGKKLDKVSGKMRESTTYSHADGTPYTDQNKGRADYVREQREMEKEREKEKGKLPQRQMGMLERLGGRAATEFGALGRAAVGLGAPAAGMAAVSAVSNKLAASLEIINTSTMSFGQKQEALLKEIVPLYGTFARLRDSITGVADSLRRLADAADRNTALANASGQYRTARYTQEREMFSAQANARAASSISMPGWMGGGFDVAYSGDRIARQEAMRRYEAQSNIQRARRAASAAAENAARLEGRAGETRTAQMSAFRRITGAAAGLDNLQRLEAARQMSGATGLGPGGTSIAPAGIDKFVSHFFNAGGDRVGRAAASNQLRSANEEYGTRQNEAFSARQAADAGIVQQRQAEVNLQRQILAAAKEELAILDQKEARMSAVQQRLGLMTDAQFELARSAAAYIKEYGLGAATSEQITLAQSVSPDYVRRLGEERGQGRAGELANQFGTRDDFRDFAAGGESLAGVRGRQNSMGQAIAEAADRIEVQFADVMSTTVTQAFMRAIEMFANRFTQALREFEAKLAIRNAMQG